MGTGLGAEKITNRASFMQPLPFYFQIGGGASTAIFVAWKAKR
jgi:hypothetical protein